MPGLKRRRGRRQNRRALLLDRRRLDSERRVLTRTADAMVVVAVLVGGGQAFKALAMIRDDLDDGASVRLLAQDHAVAGHNRARRVCREDDPGQDCLSISASHE
jgi:hypothetical protein